MDHGIEQREMNPYESPSLPARDRPRTNYSRAMAAGCCVVIATCAGFLIGVIVAPMAIIAVLVSLSGDEFVYDGPNLAIGFLMLVLGPVGAIVGAIVGIRLAKRPSRRPDINRNVVIELPREDP